MENCSALLTEEDSCAASNEKLYKFYAALVILIFILALPLNGSVLHLFIFKLKFWKSNTNNVFLFNLVLADVLLLFCLPIKAYNFLNSDRRSDNDTVCKDVTDSLRETVFFTQIIIPFFILVYCTVCIVNRLRRKTVGDRAKLKRAVGLVTSVMVVFSLCFLPCAIARMVLLIVRVQELDSSIQTQAVEAFDGLMILSYLDCLLDPLVYCFCSTKFQEIYLSSYFPFLMKNAPGQTESSTKNMTESGRGAVI